MIDLQSDLAAWQDALFDASDVTAPAGKCALVQRHYEVRADGRTVADGFRAMLADPKRYRKNMIWMALNILDDLPTWPRGDLVEALAGLGANTASWVWQLSPFLTDSEAATLHRAFAGDRRIERRIGDLQHGGRRNDLLPGGRKDRRRSRYVRQRLVS